MITKKILIFREARFVSQSIYTYITLKAKFSTKCPEHFFKLEKAIVLVIHHSTSLLMSLACALPLLFSNSQIN